MAVSSRAVAVSLRSFVPAALCELLNFHGHGALMAAERAVVLRKPYACLPPPAHPCSPVRTLAPCVPLLPSAHPTLLLAPLPPAQPPGHFLPRALCHAAWPVLPNQVSVVPKQKPAPESPQSRPARISMGFKAATQAVIEGNKGEAKVSKKKVKTEAMQNKIMHEWCALTPDSTISVASEGEAPEAGIPATRGGGVKAGAPS
ncbi:hypothetical protein CYMTET_27633 [Cymbomonas tetramitiformis]|uniref:Uncharacterized protein n=1 Tax=Cymbomonas tetramitiformis TaxID=36881 RepID=A0AAE0KWZ5_9CHLO|nr:hypothetical protein CYMTET_27633 [Cymbomonas tetramitiformis]